MTEVSKECPDLEMHFGAPSMYNWYVDADEVKAAVCGFIDKKDWTNARLLMDAVEMMEKTHREIRSAVEVKPQWRWPEWLKAEYIAMDRCGAWHAFSSDKVFANENTGCWQSGSFSMPLPDYMVAFDPPHNERDRWNYSLTPNPRICR